MSDPIRSISQNNFILADQKEVSHDNTLSGNGTLESPLGLNETVLFENSAGVSVSNGITCSENPFNFEELKIYWFCENDTSKKIDFISPAYLGANNKFNLSYSMPADNFENMNYMYLRNCTMTLTTSGISLKNAQQAVLYQRSVTTGPESSQFAIATIFKVVGINRIANN